MDHRLSGQGLSRARGPFRTPALLLAESDEESDPDWSPPPSWSPGRARAQDRSSRMALFSGASSASDLSELDNPSDVESPFSSPSNDGDGFFPLSRAPFMSIFLDTMLGTLPGSSSPLGGSSPLGSRQSSLAPNPPPDAVLTPTQSAGVPQDALGELFALPPAAASPPRSGRHSTPGFAHSAGQANVLADSFDSDVTQSDLEGQDRRNDASSQGYATRSDSKRHGTRGTSSHQTYPDPVSHRLGHRNRTRSFVDEADLPEPKRHKASHVSAGVLPSSSDDPGGPMTPSDSSTCKDEGKITALPPVQKLPTLANESPCPICLEPPRNAVATPCGHMLCGECLFKSVRPEALAQSQRREEADREDVARSVLFARPRRSLWGVPKFTPPMSSHVPERVFLSSAQLMQTIHTALCHQSRDVLQSFILANRHPPTQSWNDLLDKIIATAHKMRFRRSPSSQARDRTRLTAHVSNQSIHNFIDQEPSETVAIMLTGSRGPSSDVEKAIDAIREEMLVDVQPGSYPDDEAEQQKQPLMAYEVCWYLFKSSPVDMGAESLFEARKLLRAIQSAGEIPSPDRPCDLPGRVPHVTASVAATMLSDLLQYVRKHNVLDILNSRTPACVHEGLDQISASLWSILDADTARRWTYAEFWAEGKRQLAQARGVPPPTLQGQRRTYVQSEDIDPMMGMCPVCRSHIPGGFFTGAKQGGVQGLQFKLAKPADEARLRYGDRFWQHIRAGNVHPVVLAQLRQTGTRSSSGGGVRRRARRKPTDLPKPSSLGMFAVHGNQDKANTYPADSQGGAHGPSSSTGATSRQARARHSLQLPNAASSSISEGYDASNPIVLS